MVLKGCFYVGASLCRLCVFSAFGVMPGFDMDASHIFPQGVLATVNSIESVAGVGGSRAYVACEVGLSLCFLSLPCQSWGVLFSCWSRSPEGQADQALLTLSAFPVTKEGIAEASEAHALTLTKV